MLNSLFPKNYIEPTMSLDDELSKRIKYVVSMAQEIPFYKRKFKELNIDSQKIRTPQDLLKAYKKGLYTSGSDLPYVIYYSDNRTKEFLTSGTSGKPKKVSMNYDDEDRIVAQSTPLFRKAFDKSEKILNCFPEHPAISGHMANCALSALGYNFIHAPAQKIKDDANKFLEFYNKIKATAFMSLTTFAYRLPVNLEKIGIDSRELGIRTILTSGESSSIERRKKFGNEFGSIVYDFYGTSEGGMLAYEKEPFTNEYIITLPWTLISITKDGEEVSIGETGDVLLTNLYDPIHHQKPWAILLNYRIGDWARCLEKRDDEVVTLIGDVRRWAAYLAGAKLDPTELEKIIEDLRAEGVGLTGEYAVINYYDEERRAVAEVRMEIAKSLTLQEREEVERKIREKIYESNYPVWEQTEVAKNARLIIKLTTPGKLYQGYEHLIKPGKPRRLLTIQ